MVSEFDMAFEYACSQGLACCSASARPEMRGVEQAAGTVAIAHMQAMAHACLTQDKDGRRAWKGVCMKH
jgi:hypothetical protein